MKNHSSITIPETVGSYKNLKPFVGATALLQQNLSDDVAMAPPLKKSLPHRDKLCHSLEEALDKVELKNGMTVSFHHHLRAGDQVVLQTMELLHRKGLRDLTLASSSLTSAHEPLVQFIEDGTISRIWSSGIRGTVGEAISHGLLKEPVIIHSHGGRARAVKTGRLKIDLAVIAASAADEEGNATGAFGPSAFGSIGYAMPDMQYARQVIVVTDNLVDFPCQPFSIEQIYVDYVAKVDSIGDPAKIATGTTRITKAPMDLRIASLAARVIEHSGFFQDGFSFQVGAGGASLAVAKFLRDAMKREKITSRFVLGGVTSYITDMLNEGLTQAVFDVQSFDAQVATSLHDHPRHIAISSDFYANPFNSGCMTNKLDVVVLGALEVDVDFNVNVITGSDGCIRGASGGHCDTAAGARLTVIVCPSYRGRIPIVRKHVLNVVTPGESVDVIVTERGICVNPAHEGLADRLRQAGLPVKDIHALADEVLAITGEPAEVPYTDKIVGLIEYRDGTILDVIRQVRNPD